jgi:hypothetical protein
VGSRAADKLKEIEELRASLGGKLEEIEKRLPLAGFGKKAAMALAGSSVAGSVLAFGFRRVRGGRKRKRAKESAAPAFAPVSVNVFPKGAAWLTAAGLAAWAGVKVYEVMQRAKDGAAGSPSRPAVVTQMPESGRQTHAGP